MRKGAQKMNDKPQNIGHILDLAKRAYLRNIYTYSAFLSILEQGTIKKELIKAGFTSWYFYGGNEAAIRKIIIFGDENEIPYEPEIPVCAIKICPVSEKYAQSLSHRDYLGAIMNLGIDRSMTGDIIIKDNVAWLLCLRNTAEYISDNLNKVKNTDVKCSVHTDSVPEIEPEFEEIKLNVSSERLDCICAAILSKSRGTAQALIKDERVFINEACITDAGTRLKAGDSLVIRGTGKFIYEGIEAYTKKGRSYINVKKYT